MWDVPRLATGQGEAAAHQRRGGTHWRWRSPPAAPCRAQRKSVVGERTGLYVGPDGDEDLYELVLILGGGGQGQVWKAQMRPDRDSRAVVHYAVKVIEPADDDEAEIDWIRRAKSLWNLDHPGLVRMFEPFVGAPMHYAGCATGRTGERVRYLVMDLVDGQPLNEWIEDNPAATLSQRIGTLRMIAAALDMMHLPSRASDRSPVAHGDIKPSNILVQPSGASKLVDFGLARVVGARGVPGVGSLPYLAPELLSSADGLPTPDSDRFSFAATLFTVLTGALPPRSADRGPDLDRTRAMLAASPLVSTREGLLEQVMEGLGEPAGRPRGLATWLEGFRTQTMTTPVLFPAGSPSPAARRPAAPPPPPAGTRPDRRRVGSGAAGGRWECPGRLPPRHRPGRAPSHAAPPVTTAAADHDGRRDDAQRGRVAGRLGHRAS